MKIVYLVLRADFLTGGMRVIFEQANRLSARGHKVEVWTKEPVLLEWFERKIPIINSDSVKDLSADVLVVTDASHLEEGLARIKAKKRFFLAQHDLELIAGSRDNAGKIETLRKIFKTFGPNYRFLSVSAWVAEAFLSHYGLLSRIVPNGADAKLFHPAEPMLKIKNPTALFFYDLQDWKGGSEAFSALIGLAQNQIPDLKILVVGKYFPIFQKASEENISALLYPIIFFSCPRQEDLARVYSSATVFLSTSWFEGFGMPGLEAMACGVPLVTTDAGGTREYAIDGETAIVVPVGNIEAMKDGILKLIRNEPLRKKMAENGLKKAKEFDWEKSIDILEEEFQKG